MTQIGLPLDWQSVVDQDQFFVSAANQRAVDFLDDWQNWPVRAAVLCGPAKSGRSLLGRRFAEKHSAMVIDDAAQRNETWLFHHWNAAQESGIPLLLIASTPPDEWTIDLLDLKSRLAMTPVLSLLPPDEKLMIALFEKFLKLRGLTASEEVLRYLNSRYERSYTSILEAADRLETAAWSHNRALTLPFVKETLGHSEGQQHDLI